MAPTKTEDSATPECDEQASDQDTELDWNPSSSVDGRGYSSTDFADELADHLPDEWEVVEFDIWGPREVNHGGKGGYDATVEHVSGATVAISPASTFPPRDGSKTVYNSHCVVRELADGTTTEVADAREMASKEDPSEAFGVLVAAAEEFQDRWSLFH